MLGSSERIMTTPVGSLARSERLLTVLTEMEHGEIGDRGAFRTQARSERADVDVPAATARHLRENYGEGVIAGVVTTPDTSR